MQKIFLGVLGLSSVALTACIDVKVPQTPKPDLQMQRDATPPADMVASDMPTSDVASVLADMRSPNDTSTHADGASLPKCTVGLGLDRVERDLVYAATDARNVLDLYLPKDPGLRPLIIWIHGGGWRGGTNDIVPAQISRFIRRGYAIASVEYRLSDHPWPAPIADVKAAIRWLRAHADQYGLAPQRFATSGNSAGGHLAALAGTSGSVAQLADASQGNASVSDTVQAVVDFFGPVDFLLMDQHASEAQCPSDSMCHTCTSSPETTLLDCTPDISACPTKVAEASPVTYVDVDDPPIMMVHGLDDCSVPSGQSKLLANALDQVGVENQLILVPNAGHNMGAVSVPSTEVAVTNWLERHLRRCLP